jgi:hypothetical protein
MPIAQVASQVIHNVKGLQNFVDQLHAHVAAVGPLDVATVGLWTANIDPGPNNLLADLIEASVAGPPAWAEYLRIATTGWGPKETRVDGSILIVATPLLSWTGPAAGGGPTVRGAVVISPLAGTPLLYSCKFVTPIAMTDATQQLDLALPFVLPGNKYVY